MGEEHSKIPWSSGPEGGRQRKSSRGGPERIAQERIALVLLSRPAANVRLETNSTGKHHFAVIGDESSELGIRPN